MILSVPPPPRWMGLWGIDDGLWAMPSCISSIEAIGAVRPRPTSCWMKLRRGRLPSRTWAIRSRRSCSCMSTLAVWRRPVCQRRIAGAFTVVEWRRFRCRRPTMSLVAGRFALSARLQPHQESSMLRSMSRSMSRSLIVIAALWKEGSFPFFLGIEKGGASLFRMEKGDATRHFR